MSIYLDTHDGCRVLTGFGRPFGLAHDGRGRLYVSDMDLHAVFRFANDLRTVEVLGGAEVGWSASQPVRAGRGLRAPPAAPGIFNGPHCVEPGRDETLFVTTYYAPEVQVFNAAGERVRTLGGRDSTCPLEGPATSLLDGEGRLLVAEYRQHAVAAFSADGQPLGRLGMDPRGRPLQFADGPTVATAAAGGFDRPHMCRQAPDGSLIVCDTWNHRLQRFAADGAWRGWLGARAEGLALNAWSDEVGAARQGAAPAEFHAPVALDFRGDGLGVVTDWGNHRVQFIAADGRLLAACDWGLCKPYDARFWDHGLVVADSHHARVCLVPLPAGLA